MPCHLVNAVPSCKLNVVYVCQYNTCILQRAIILLPIQRFIVVDSALCVQRWGRMQLRLSQTYAREKHQQQSNDCYAILYISWTTWPTRSMLHKNYRTHIKPSCWFCSIIWLLGFLVCVHLHLDPQASLSNLLYRINRHMRIPVLYLVE